MTPIPTRRPHTRLKHMPALDGLRGLAVAAVLLFHGGFLWAKGGYLGVTVFFVLSGFLITSLLLAERERTGGISLRAFWGRRARRLAPAILVLIALVAAFEQWGITRRQPQVFGDAVSALLWVANWRFLLGHRVYADLFAGPSPFQHTWSLAIEEQFYVLVALLAVIFIARRTDSEGRKALGAFGAVAIVYAALVPFGVLGFHATPDQLYYRTDIRMAEPLIGVLLALLLLQRGRVIELAARGRRLVGALGIVGVGALVFFVATLGEHSHLLFKGGLIATSLAAAAVVTASTQKGTIINRAFAFKPLVALGKISYGVYLFHWPIDLWLSPRRTGLAHVPLFTVRTVVALAVATLSYYAIEQPIRRGSLRPARLALISWADAALGVMALLLIVTLVAPAKTQLLASGDTAGSYTPPVTTVPPAVPGASTTTAVAGVTRTTTRSVTPTTRKKVQSGGGGGGALFGPIKPAAPPPTVPPTDPTPPLKVAVIGDSMANSLAKGLAVWANERSDVTVYDLSISGCPLSRGYGEEARRVPDGQGGYNYLAIDRRCEWWDPGDPTADPDRWNKFEAFSPDVIVMQDGMNELPDRENESTGSYRAPGDPGYDNWLLSEYDAALRRFTANGAKVVFLNTVCADWALVGYSFENYEIHGEGDRRVSDLDRTDAAVGLAHGFTTGDLQARICPNGKFTQNVEGYDDARSDGYHITSVDASAALARNWLGPMIFSAAGKTPTSS